MRTRALAGLLLVVLGATVAAAGDAAIKLGIRIEGNHEVGHAG